MYGERMGSMLGVEVPDGTTTAFAKHEWGGTNSTGLPGGSRGLTLDYGQDCRLPASPSGRNG